ncbi:biotin attachment protein [Natronomonas halophila]|uniref:lipoyl domain-containing protein n=1 Tax=Natronomonas halophila TaxID=2747817 RepID=UPI0015B6088E|nr:lipoyl domain-containing protein [Natronomonas halophila]QLD86774.1 biotin attachment protein [Natronomonas halophila]
MSGNRVAVGTEELWPDDADEDEGYVANWFVREGATVDEGDTLCEIQIEKVSIDVTSPVAGQLVEIVLGEDAEFERGATVAYIDPA